MTSERAVSRGPSTFLFKAGLAPRQQHTVPQGRSSTQGWDSRQAPGQASTQVGHRNGTFQEGMIARDQLHCTAMLGKVFRAYHLTDIREGTSQGLVFGLCPKQISTYQALSCLWLL